MLYEFKTRLLERLKGIRHSSRPSLKAVWGDIGIFRLLISDSDTDLLTELCFSAVRLNVRILDRS
jgi:hypothetical protein